MTQSGAPAGLDQAEVLADLEAQRAERVVDDLGLVGAEEHEVAGLRARALACRPATAASDRNFRIGDCRPSRPFAASFTLT